MGKEQSEGQTNKTRQQKTLSSRDLAQLKIALQQTQLQGSGEKTEENTYLFLSYFFPQNTFCLFNRRGKTEEATKGE